MRTEVLPVLCSSSFSFGEAVHRCSEEKSWLFERKVFLKGFVGGMESMGPDLTPSSWTYRIGRLSAMNPSPDQTLAC